jgi:hypothetical protein
MTRGARRPHPVRSGCTWASSRVGVFASISAPEIALFLADAGRLMPCDWQDQRVTLMGLVFCRSTPGAIQSVLGTFHLAMMAWY